MKDLEGRLADATGLSSATPIEPVPVSPLRASIPSAQNHAETGHLDTSKERALRLDYEQADAEVQTLKKLLAKTRAIPLSEEVEAMFYWRDRALYYEELLNALHMNPRERFDRLAQAIEARRAATGTGAVHESAVPKECAHPQPVGSETATDAAKREGEA